MSSEETRQTKDDFNEILQWKKLKGKFQMLNKHFFYHVKPAKNQGSLYNLLVDTFSVILLVTFNRPAVRKLLMFMLKALHSTIFTFQEY